MYPSGTFEFHIDVVNLFNSRNENLRLRVLGQLVNCPIQFTHLDSDGCLKLPPVSPYEQSGVSTESFAIVNRDSETSHEIHLDVHTFEEFRDLCSIKVCFVIVAQSPCICSHALCRCWLAIVPL